MPCLLYLDNILLWHLKLRDRDKRCSVVTGTLFTIQGLFGLVNLILSIYISVLNLKICSRRFNLPLHMHMLICNWTGRSQGKSPFCKEERIPVEEQEKYEFHLQPHCFPERGLSH